MNVLPVVSSNPATAQKSAHPVERGGDIPSLFQGVFAQATPAAQDGPLPSSGQKKHAIADPATSDAQHEPAAQSVISAVPPIPILVAPAHTLMIAAKATTAAAKVSAPQQSVDAAQKDAPGDSALEAARPGGSLATPVAGENGNLHSSKLNAGTMPQGSGEIQGSSDHLDQAKVAIPDLNFHEVAKPSAGAATLQGPSADVSSSARLASGVLAVSPATTGTNVGTEAALSGMAQRPVQITTAAGATQAKGKAMTSKEPRSVAGKSAFLKDAAGTRGAPEKDIALHGFVDPNAADKSLLHSSHSPAGGQLPVDPGTGRTEPAFRADALTPQMSVGAGSQNMQSSQSKGSADAAAPNPGEAQVATPATGAVHSARLIQSLNQSEMRLGMHSAEFGKISIQASLSRDQMAASISVDHGELGKALSLHLPEMQMKLDRDHGMHSQIDVLSQNATGTGGQQAGQHGQQESSAQPHRATGQVSPLGDNKRNSSATQRAAAASRSGAMIGQASNPRLDVRM